MNKLLAVAMIAGLISAVIDLVKRLISLARLGIRANSDFADISDLTPDYSTGQVRSLPRRDGDAPRDVITGRQSGESSRFPGVGP